MTQYNSYNNNQEFKNQVVAAIIADKENERIVQGKYWDTRDSSGCNVGCGEHAVCQILGENRKVTIPEPYL